MQLQKVFVQRIKVEFKSLVNNIQLFFYLVTKKQEVLFWIDI
jgi:hypothetical protein